MGFFSNLLKLSVKSSIVGGAVYLTVEQGVWKDSKESLQVYERAKQEVPKLDKYVPGLSSQIEKLNIDKGILWSVGDHKPVAEYWNDGVFTTFKFLIKLPEHVLYYSSVASDEIKKLINQS